MEKYSSRCPVDRRAVPLSLSMVALVTLAGCVSQAVHDQALKEKDNLAQNVSSLEERLAAEKSRNENLDAKLSEANTELAKVNQSLKDKNAELLRLNDVINRRNQEIQSALAELNSVNKEVEARKAELEAKNAALVETGQALAEATQRAMAAEEAAKKTHNLYDDLVGDLKNELAANQIKIEELKDGIKLNLSEDILFPSGSAELNTSGREVIQRVSQRLKESAYFIEVAGFTDNVPIKGTLTSKYPSNWELAAARAASVIRVWAASGVELDKMMAVSFGENRPVASNDTADGRRQNRRIEVRLRPHE